MLLPSPGTLLKGLAGSLRDGVLPNISTVSAQKQMKAALHLLARLEKTWDLFHQHVETDNADIEAALQKIFSALASHDQRLIALKARFMENMAGDKPVAGFNDPEAAAMAAANIRLREILQALEEILAHAPDENQNAVAACQMQLAGLYQRMAMRDAIYVGDLPVAERG